MGNELAVAKRELTVFVNGKQRHVSVDPSTPLSTWLRSTLGLTGTKVGCGTGACGACTVMISRMDYETQVLTFFFFFFFFFCFFVLTGLSFFLFVVPGSDSFHCQRVSVSCECCRLLSRDYGGGF